MKDLIITAKRQKREWLLLLACFVLAFGCNIYAIIYYNGYWSELYTDIFYVFALTIAFYALLVLARLLVKGIRCLLVKKAKNTV